MAEKQDKISSNDKKLKSALIKKALGYSAKEVIEEYVSDEGEIKLYKKKITKKNVPPDITAIKMLLDNSADNLSSLSDEELLKEKERLLKILKDTEENS